MFFFYLFLYFLPFSLDEDPLDDFEPEDDGFEPDETDFPDEELLVCGAVPEGDELLKGEL
jgi:hypothetical protein